MKKQLVRLIALCLAAALLLGGCSGIDLKGYFQKLGALFSQGMAVSFGDMTYTRPEPEKLQKLLQQCCQRAKTETDVEALMEDVYAFYQEYYDFYTNYMLSDIHYCLNMLDIYWEEEYNYCLSYTAQADAALDELLYALAACPLKEELEAEEYFGQDFFDAYTGASIWDETFTSLSNQEAELLTTYYDLCAQALEVEYYSDAYFETYGTQMAELYVELIALRQEMAEYAGYADYPSFAYDFYYYRDYTPAQAEAYLEEVRLELLDLYLELPYEVWEAGYEASSEAQTFAYVKTLAQKLGGTAQEAFSLLESANLYDISYGENKYDASFAVYLPSYMEPFIFVNPTGVAGDQLIFAHEFGHFCNDYASGGSVAGVDVAEIFSQAMEYLSICTTEQGEKLQAYKLGDSLCTFVEQAAYASFEQQVYALTGDELTVENVQALYERIGKEYGFESWSWDSRDYVAVPHSFTNPMYIVSYVVSNDAAFQIYQMEQQEPGSGAALLEAQFNTQEPCFLAFLEDAGLESPFTQGRLAKIRETFEQTLSLD